MNTNDTTTTTLTVTRNGQSVTFEHVTGMAWEGQADLRQVTPFKSQSGKTHTLRTFLMDGVEIDAATPGLARQALDALLEHRAANSTQGVAWDTRNVASAAYFRIVGA